MHDIKVRIFQMICIVFSYFVLLYHCPSKGYGWHLQSSSTSPQSVQLFAPVLTKSGM